MPNLYLSRSRCHGVQCDAIVMASETPSIPAIVDTITVAVFHLSRDFSAFIPFKIASVIFASAADRSIIRAFSESSYCCIDCANEDRNPLVSVCS